MSEPMLRYAIYDKPSDYPESFVMRLWHIYPGIEPLPTTKVEVAPTLEEIRQHIPEGFACISRFPNDDPKIVEVWI